MKTARASTLSRSSTRSEQSAKESVSPTRSTRARYSKPSGAAIA